MRSLAAIALWLLLSSVALADEEPVVKKITGNVFSIYSGHYTSLVVIGDEGVLITDPANTYRAQLLKEIIAELSPLPVSHVLLTHEHYDHVGGTGVFEDAIIVVQKKALAVFSLDTTGVTPKAVDETFDQSYSIQMAETQVDMLHFGVPSDGVANAVVHLPREGIVYSADFYEDNELVSRAFIDSFNSLGARLVLNKLVALKPKYAIAAHSPSADVEDLHMATDFFNDLYEAVHPVLMAARANGYEAELEASKRLPQKIQLKKYENMTNYGDLDRHTERMIESILHGG